MSAFFPGVEEILTILMAEMPASVYSSDRADNPATLTYSSSEIRTVAQMYANLYANLEDLYENKFLTTVQPDGISQWETDLFTTVTDASQPFNIRVANALAKYRARGGLNYAYISNIISNVLTPLGLSFQLITYNCANSGGNGAWVLDVSLLDVTTYLGLTNPLYGSNQALPYQLDCNAVINVYGTTTATSHTITNIRSTSGVMVNSPIVGPGIPANTIVDSITSNTIVMSQAAVATATNVPIQIQNYWLAGVSTQEFQDIQTVAYTYEVDIYGNASAATLSELNQLLTAAEKATVTHVIVNNVPPPIPGPIPAPISGLVDDMGQFLADIQVDNINCGTFTTLPVTWDIWDYGDFL